MPLDLVALLKVVGPKAISFVRKVFNDGVVQRRVRRSAMAGEDLSGKGSLETLVKAQLAKLTTSSALPPELQNDAFRTWVLSAGAADRFVTVLIAQAGDDPQLADRAREDLAYSYEQVVGETSRLASGPISLVVSDLYGQLTATASAKQAFESAVSLRSAARLEGLVHPELRPFPTQEDLGRLRNVATALLEAGRRTWKMPVFVAPLALEANESRGDNEAHPVTSDDLVAAVDSGHSVVLYGDGGIGKTTFLLEMASSLERNTQRKTPLYVDAAAWSRAGGGILDYIALTPAAQAARVTASELTRFAQSGNVALLVNGWNEIPAERKLDCREAFNQLTTAAPYLTVVVASRTVHDAASLPLARRIAVRGLTWQGQSAVVRSELPEGVGGALLEVLARDTRLRHAARSPLILHGLISQASTGVSVALASVYDLLGAVVSTFESDDKREMTLAPAPVYGRHTRYLEELACSMNARGTTNLLRDEALAVIGATAHQLSEERLLGATPQPMAVLDILSSHHVLHLQDGLVRFAHQRFQEYFSAARLLRLVGQPSDPILLLGDAVNQPAWADALALVAGKLNGAATAGPARTALVRTVLELDLSYACELVGLCGFSQADDATLHQRLLTGVNALKGSSITNVRELGTACQIASRLPVFADDLWVLFESDDQQTRLYSHRLSGSRTALSQLGPGAQERVATWASDRRSEFIHETAGNPDNCDYIAGIAADDADPNVRAAAISSLFWHYPASNTGVNAWLKAPLEVQTKHDLVSYIGYAVEQGVNADQIRAQLRIIAAQQLSDDSRLQLALAFPAEVGSTAVDMVLARLRTEERRGDPDRLLSIAKAEAPERLRSLAFELVAGPGLPEWAGLLLLDGTADFQAAAFERAWEALQTDATQRLSPQLVGPLASIHQTRRSVGVLLEQWVNRRSELTEAQRNRGNEVGYLLANAPGNDVLAVVMELGADASYDVSAELVQLLLTRVSRGDGGMSAANPWSPTPEQFTELFELFSGKAESVRPPQDSLFTYLACIASHVAPAQFGHLLLEALRRHLDAWTAYRAVLDEWLKSPGRPRPNNPSLGNYVISALARWGADALPGVLEALSHPNAMDLVPEALGRILNLPWVHKTTEKVFSRGVSTDVAEGRRRRAAGRVLLQPSDDYQAVTNEAATAIARLLNAEVERQVAERDTNPRWNARTAEYQVGRLVGILANIPSSEVVVPVTRALGTGLLGLYGVLGALTGLIRQGWQLSDAAVVRELESLLQREASPKWVDDSTRYAIGEAFQLTLLVEPSDLLKAQLVHYLREWQRFAHASEVIRVLGELRTERAWSALLALGNELSAKQPLPEEFAYSLAAALTPSHLAEFTRLVREGTLLPWFGNVWTIERVAATVAESFRQAPEQLSSLVDSCRKIASAPADALLLEVLSKLTGHEHEQQEFALEALDSGRVTRSDTPAYRALEKAFWLRVPLSESQWEVHSRAGNLLRQQLYRRAKTSGTSADASRRLLASLELSRREDNRPTDEPRHPERTDGMAWTDALALPSADVAQG